MTILHPQSTGRSRSAFTLIEIVISASLMAMILVAAYLCLNAGLSTQKMVDPRTEVIQNARVAMAIVTADLRNACPLVGTSDFLGMPRQLGSVEADNLDFATHNYTPRRAHEGDYCEESLYMDKNPQTGLFSLWRRRNPSIALDPLSGGSKEEIATGVVGLKLEYYDGLDWYDTWGEIKRGKLVNTKRSQPNLSGMPSAVRVTLLLDSNPKPQKKSEKDETTERVIEPPLAFQTVVQLNLTAASLDTSLSSPKSSSDSDGDSASPNDNPGNPDPNGGNL